MPHWRLHRPCCTDSLLHLLTLGRRMTAQTSQLLWGPPSKSMSLKRSSPLPRSFWLNYLCPLPQPFLCNLLSFLRFFSSHSTWGLRGVWSCLSLQNGLALLSLKWGEAQTKGSGNFKNLRPACSQLRNVWLVATTSPASSRHLFSGQRVKRTCRRTHQMARNLKNEYANEQGSVLIYSSFLPCLAI